LRYCPRVVAEVVVDVLLYGERANDADRHIEQMDLHVAEPRDVLRVLAQRRDVDLGGCEGGDAAALLLVDVEALGEVATEARRDHTHGPGPPRSRRWCRR
jgi:hypothetical protein